MTKENEIIKIEGWKVLLASRDSVSNWNKIIPNPLALNYPVDVEVFPKKGKLFFFVNKKDAENFWYTCSNKCIMVKCIATNPRTAEEKSLADCLSDIYRFHEVKNAYVHLIDPPLGTYTADSITCLE